MSYSELEKIIQSQKLKTDTDLIRLAFEFAQDAHKNHKRLSGEPYIVHPLEVAKILAKTGLDQDTIIAGLLHDVPEDTGVSLQQIEKDFGKEVAFLISGITKLGNIKYRGIERYVENLRGIFVAMAKDIRVILIKFADRLHNLKTLEFLPEAKRERIALETLEVYAPIAHRLGISEFKDKLEDEAFKYALPQEFERTKKIVEENLGSRIIALEKSKNILEKYLNEKGVRYLIIQGRHKGLYSLYKKLVAYDEDIGKIYDLVALRVIVNTVADCYAVLGYIHQIWRPMNGRVKDYIAQPKPNGYSSLHTTIFGEDNLITEFQIRTEQMHQEAEYGIASHWRYKEGPKRLPDNVLSWVEELAKWHIEVPDTKQYLEILKKEILGNRIFVFTPKGDVIDLPESSTSVDFAYRVHTDLGNHCVGSYVNDHIASLDTKLKSGDMVNILIDKNRKGPSLDWLSFAKTHHARTQIKHFYKSINTPQSKSQKSSGKKR